MPPPSRALGRRLIGAVGLLVLAWSCRRGAPEQSAVSAAAPRAAVRPVSAAWVTVFDPARAAPGFTLTLHDLRIPVLLDMNGRVVHAWPDARLKSRVRLLPDGSILGLGLGRSVAEYDWNGKKTWEFRTEGAFPHHDVIRLANGNTLVLVFREGGKPGEAGDTLLEVDRGGTVVWSWNWTRLGALLPARPAHEHDVTHINSVQELPDNPRHRAGDRRFRPGNLLVSARNLNMLFVLDRASGDVVWSYRGTLDRQHEALMTGLDAPSPGAILVLDNRPASYFGDHRSAVLEIDPQSGRVLWSFARPGFFTPTSGTEQPLPNGNLLITSTRGGRIFEITRAGQVVWEWVPPYEPVRALRVARDACPQLAALAVAPPRPVTPAAGYRYVDSDAYRFARRGSRRRVTVEGIGRSVLAAARDCRDLQLPLGATLEVSYGVDRERLRRTGGGAPTFVLSVEAPGGPRAVLLREAVGPDGPPWRHRVVPLDAYALRGVRLCVEIEGDPATAAEERFAFFEQPSIHTALDLARASDPADALDGLTPEERAVQLQHLRSLGYIN